MIIIGQGGHQHHLDVRPGGEQRGQSCPARAYQLPFDVHDRHVDVRAATPGGADQVDIEQRVPEQDERAVVRPHRGPLSSASNAMACSGDLSAVRGRCLDRNRIVGERRRAG